MSRQKKQNEVSSAEEQNKKIINQVVIESMDDVNIDNLIEKFEKTANLTEDGFEFWYARDLQELFEYGEWRNFRPVLEKAMTACKKSGHEIEDHFVHVHEMVEIGSGANRKIEDIQLSRYACYLVAQNADPRKKPVAFAQTYFAIQTRRQELADTEDNFYVPKSEDEKRVILRNQIKEHNRYLSSAAKDAGVETSQEFAIFHSNGYQGLYGKTVPQIRKYKGLAKSADILDRMGSTELAANFFRVTQTEEKLRQDEIKDKKKAYKTHYEVGRQVRDAMLQISGVAPEDLPAVDSIKKAEKRIRDESHKSIIPKTDKTTENDHEPKPINLKYDLWKYALLVMALEPEGEVKTADLINELPKYIAVPDEVNETLASRSDTKFSQLVRNLKSHKTSKTNFIYQGYAESTHGGFKITKKGMAFVKDYFSE